MKNKKWKRIDNFNVRHCWICVNHKCGEYEESGNNGISVSPDFYETSGTPICIDCGDDMRYVCTEILTEE